MSNRKPLEELTLLDDFMFGQVMSRVDVGRRFLEQLFQEKIRSINLVHSQSTYQESYDSHGVRFDVEFEGDGRFYNIEMQQQGSAGEKGKLLLANRARYYHAALLNGHFKSGEDYDKVPATRVIFTCDFDPIGAGEPVYFQIPYVIGHPKAMPVQEVTTYLNVRYKEECVGLSRATPEILEFLSFIRDGVTLGLNPLSRMASAAVSEVKTSYEGRRNYMSYMDAMKRERAEESEERLKALIRNTGMTEAEARRLLDLPPVEDKGTLHGLDLGRLGK